MSRKYDLTLTKSTNQENVSNHSDFNITIIIGSRLI